jgi:hypothetical protein
MRQYSVLLILAATVVSCGVNESPIKLLDVAAMEALSTVEETVCTPSSDFFLSAGAVDINPLVSPIPTYFAWFRMESNMQPIVTATGGDVIAGASRNDWYSSRVFYTYESIPPTTWESESNPAYIVLRAAEGDDRTGGIVLNLIQPKAAARLTTLATPLELFVSVRVDGALSSGQAISSNTITFPINVYRSGFTGCGSAPLALTGPCGFASQDGAPLICCDAAAAADAGTELNQLCPQ